MTQYLSTDPEIMGGRPCFPGTRVEFSTLINYLVDGYTFDEFMANFPSVDRDDAVRALEAATPPMNSDGVVAVIERPLNENFDLAFGKMEAQLAEWDSPLSLEIGGELDWFRKSQLCELLQEGVDGARDEVVTLMYLSEEDEAIEMEWRGDTNIFCVTLDLPNRKARWHNTDLKEQSATDGDLPPIDTEDAISKIRSLLCATFGGTARVAE